MHIKGLLEMMFDKLAGWIDEFIADMEVRPFNNPTSESYSVLAHRVQVVHLSPGARPRQDPAHAKLSSYISDRGSCLQNVEAASDGSATPPSTRPGTPPSVSPGHGQMSFPALHTLPGMRFLQASSTTLVFLADNMAITTCPNEGFKATQASCTANKHPA